MCGIWLLHVVWIVRLLKPFAKKHSRSLFLYEDYRDLTRPSTDYMPGMNLAISFDVVCDNFLKIPFYPCTLILLNLHFVLWDEIDSSSHINAWSIFVPTAPELLHRGRD